MNKETYAAFAGFTSILDIHSLFGPMWNDQKDLLCQFSGNDHDFCSMLDSVPVGPIAPGGTIFGFSEISTKSLMHLAQNVVTREFHDYEEYFILNDILGIDGHEIELENIVEPPYNFIYVDNDDICDTSTQKTFADRIPAK